MRCEQFIDVANDLDACRDVVGVTFRISDSHHFDIGHGPQNPHVLTAHHSQAYYACAKFLPHASTDDRTASMTRSTMCRERCGPTGNDRTSEAARSV